MQIIINLITNVHVLKINFQYQEFGRFLRVYCLSHLDSFLCQHYHPIEINLLSVQNLSIMLIMMMMIIYLHVGLIFAYDVGIKGHMKVCYL